MSFKKHVGRIKSTDQRCIVVFMQLPEDKNKALIINVEALTPRYEQMLFEVVDSKEGQQAANLADTMCRRMVPETGRTVLAEFHAKGFMRAEPVDNIRMYPSPNAPFELRDILAEMGKISGDPTTPESSQKFNHITANQNVGNEEERRHMAGNMILEAEMLEAEARKKREAAYRIMPQLRPAEQAEQAEPQLYDGQSSLTLEVDGDISISTDGTINISDSTIVTTDTKE